MGLDLRDTLSKDTDEIETEGERSHCKLLGTFPVGRGTPSPCDGKPRLSFLK